MMYAFIRWWAATFLRLYFRKTIIYGLEKVPQKGPLIVASNHPSAFMEASILSTTMKRTIHFLVRGDMFNPRFHWLFEWTKQIPIYRKKDGITNLRKNASSFDLTYRKLGEGEAVLIFPEAKTVLEKSMREIQRGTAHLAFGTMSFIKDGEKLLIQPVGVNFMDPRVPGTDVVVVFGEPFITQHASREDRDAIEQFTHQLSESLSVLIIQVDNALEKNYDVVAAIYLRLMYENQPQQNAFINLQKFAILINDKAGINIVVDQTDEIIKTLQSHKSEKALYFPDLIVFNKIALTMLALLKIAWLVSGGWLWKVVQYSVFKKIKTETFQGPTALGAFMVLMPLILLILLTVFLFADVSLLYLFLWLLIMWLGTLFRPPIEIILRLIAMDGRAKRRLKKEILMLRDYMEEVVGSR